MYHFSFPEKHVQILQLKRENTWSKTSTTLFKTSIRLSCLIQIGYYVVKNYGYIVSPQFVGLWDPFQIAFPRLINGGDPPYLRILHLRMIHPPSGPLPQGSLPTAALKAIEICHGDSSWLVELTIKRTGPKRLPNSAIPNRIK